MSADAATMPRMPPALSAALAFGGAFALLSATAKPDQKSFSWLVEQGATAEVAAWALHLAPIPLVMAVVAALAYVRGRTLVRAPVLALGGGVAGFFLARCLDVFAGTAGWVEALTGPLREAMIEEFLGWSLAILMITLGLAYLGVTAFGRPVVEIMAIRRVSPEQVENTRADRLNLSRAAWCALTMGLGLALLTLLRQADAAPGSVRLALGAGFLVCIAGSGWLQWRLYRALDELLRLASVQAYALSGVTATLGLALWAVVAEVSRTSGPSAFAAFIAFYLVQTFGSFAVSAVRIGGGACEDTSEITVAQADA